MSTEFDEDNGQILRIVDDVFGGGSRMSHYSDMDPQGRVKILSRPQKNDLISFCTVGFSDFQPPTKVSPPLGVEMLAVSEREEFARVLVATGLYAIEHGWLLSPGTIVLDVVAEHMDSPHLPHLLLHEPFLWEDSDFASRTLSRKTVAWVLGMPVSQAEGQYCYEHGFNALDELFMEAQPDLFDTQRPSVV